MDQRVYKKNINVGQIAQALQQYFYGQGFETQALGIPPNMLVQVRKKSTLRAVAGMQRAMSAQFRETNEGIMVTLGEQQWADKAAVGAVGAIIFAPLLVTAAYGTYRQAKLPEQFWRIIDSYTMPAGGPYPIQPAQQPVLSQPQPQPTPQATPQTAPTQTTHPPSDQTRSGQTPKFCPDCGTPQQNSKFCPTCGHKHYD